MTRDECRTVKILAIDPGKTTGFALWGGADDIIRPLSGQVGPKIDLYRVVLEAQPDVVVCEDFTPRPGAHSVQKDALHVIGGLEALILVGEIDAALHLQSPGQAKAFGTDDKLRRLGWWVKGQDHARDALRHLLTWLVTHPHAPDATRQALIEALLEA